MAVTKEQLIGRLSALKAQRDQIIANANACTGAIQLLEQLLGEYEWSDPPVDAGEKKDA